MKAHLIRRGKQYTVKFFDEENQRWSHQSLKTSKKALADLRFGAFLKDRQKTELLGEFNVQPIKLSDLVKEFLSYMESKRSPRYAKLVKKFTDKWVTFFGADRLSMGITPRLIEKYVIERKKEKCRIKGTTIANATVNRDLAALKHMLHKAEIWGYVEVSPGRRVESLHDDSNVRTDYFTQDQLKQLVSRAEYERHSHPNHFTDWPEFIVLAANTGLRCQEMLSLEFSDVDWTVGVLHIRNKKHLGFTPKGRREPSRGSPSPSSVSGRSFPARRGSRTSGKTCWAKWT